MTCRHCGAAKLFRANNLTDPRIRKWYLARGWDIGKHSGAHTCPDCMHKTKPPPPVLEHCSFCSKSQIDALTLIRAPNGSSLICNDCVEECAELLRQRMGETNSQRLWKAWNVCSGTEQDEFTATFRPSPTPDPGFIDVAPAPPPPPVQPAGPLPTHEWQRGPHIDNMPTQPPLAENPAPVTILEAEDDDADAEPADWWKELIQQKRH